MLFASRRRVPPDFIEEIFEALRPARSRRCVCRPAQDKSSRRRASRTASRTTPARSSRRGASRPMTIIHRARPAEHLFTLFENVRQVLGRGYDAHREQEQGSRHFNSAGNVDPSGNANTTKVEPRRKDASGNNAAAALPKMVPCQPVGVATYCRPFTEYEIADPRWPAPV